jgi:hypothetical protein
VAANAIQEIYGALLLVTSALGLVVAAVSVGAATISDALVKRREMAARENELLISAIRERGQHV